MVNVGKYTSFMELMGHVYKFKYVTAWVVVSNIFYFQPYLGKISILTNIFQMA